MNKIGVYGLGVMGSSLATNIHRHGFSLSVFNIDAVVSKAYASDKENVDAYETVSDFVNSLEKPRAIILMVTAGKVVDEVIASLVPYLEENDCIIDCGNSFYLDSERRQQELKEKGIYLIGSGVSGGEKGALLGPSIMPSGNLEAYKRISTVLEAIAAKNSDGSSCCTYIGEGGSGHFVKMVHNGIEYADMQLLADAYALLKHQYGNDLQKMHEIFMKYQSGKLQSYLVEISAKIFVKEENDEPILPKILDVAKQKGTGKWVAQVALDEGVGIPSISQAVESRFLSAQKKLRMKLNTIYETKQSADPYENLADDLEKALYFMKIMIYAQGFSLIQQVSEEKGYGVNPLKLATIWQEGCIIKSAFLKEIVKAYEENPHLSHLLLSPVFEERIKVYESSARKVMMYAIQNGISVPLMNSAIAYFDSIRCGDSTTSLIQAQRDFFGAHTYERVDQDGVFHTIWE